LFQTILNSNSVGKCLCGHRYRFHNHLHLANMNLGHLLTHSGLTHLEVPLRVSPGFIFFPVGLWFLVFSVIYLGAFCLYVATSFFFFVFLYFAQSLGYIQFFCNLFVCFIIFPSVFVSCCFFSSRLLGITHLASCETC
jgi:hypothetical protein